MLRLVQLSHPAEGRRVAVVEEPNLRLLTGHSSLYGLAQAAITSGQPLSAVVDKHLSPQVVEYETVYQSHSPWRLLPPFDHPDEPARCLVTGTGLTHKASADNRQAMHVAEPGKPVVETDSMKMYRIGLEGGRPAPGEIGAAPEWFYKGCGTILRAHGEPLDVPNFADDGGDEAEIAGAYLIGPDGTPYRVGLVQGNEFSDHVMEAKNYLYLAPSKLRTCALGPELVVGADFADVPGRIRIERGDERRLGGGAGQRRAGDVAFAGEPGTPPFQVRAAPPAGRRPSALLRGRPLQLPRPRPARGRRRDGGGVRRLRPAAAEPGADRPVAADGRSR